MMPAIIFDGKVISVCVNTIPIIRAFGILSQVKSKKKYPYVIVANIFDLLRVSFFVMFLKDMAYVLDTEPTNFTAGDKKEFIKRIKDEERRRGQIANSFQCDAKWMNGLEFFT